MKQLALLAASLSAVAAADWTLYRQGPFEVFTDRDKKQARDVLNHLEQLRWVFGQLTGKAEPKLLWPIRVLVDRSSTSNDFRLVNDSLTGTLNEKSEVPPEWNAKIVKILIENNLGRMPAEIERGLISTLSTAQVSGVHVITGLAPQDPDLDWARMHMLITNDEYQGRVRILIGNLEKGTDPDLAFRNSLGKTRAEIDRDARAHLDAKVVPTTDISGKPLNPNRDFTPREADAESIARLTAASSAPDTAMGMVEASKTASNPKALLEAASAKKPDWSEPYRLLSAVESDAGRKAGLLKKAAELSPRDRQLWTQFAALMTEYRRFADADKAWAAAERAAADPKERQAIRAQRSELVEQRAGAEADAKREAQIARERDLQRVKNDTMARIKEAEAKANAGRELPPGTKVEQWWDDPKPDAKIAGTLRRVDCLGRQLRLVVETGAKTVQLLVRDPSKLALEGSSQATLACGVQKARNVEIDYFSKPDAKLKTEGEAAVVKFP